MVVYIPLIKWYISGKVPGGFLISTYVLGWLHIQTQDARNYVTAKILFCSALHACSWRSEGQDAGKDTLEECDVYLLAWTSMKPVSWAQGYIKTIAVSLISQY